MTALPVPGERWKLHEFTRIFLGSKAEVHAVSLPTWKRWAEKARKESTGGR